MGGGTMGVGIAHTFLAASVPVVIVEVDAARADAAADAVAASLRRAGDRGHVDDAAAAIRHLDSSSDRDRLRVASLVIEAVPEDPALKASVLAEVEAILEPAAILATNTSSISINALSDGLLRPQRFLGMHFFNPVPASALVELVRGRSTDQFSVDAAAEWVERIGKQTIVVHDSPGFASSRLGLAIGLEAIRMLEGGVATAEDIDAAMVLGYRFPMGPLRLTDLVGLDVRLDIAEYLHAELGDRFAPPQLLRDKVARGELGKKAGKGFFEWR